MIPPEILNRKSLFSLLHRIDLDLAEQTRARRCPFAGGRYIMQTILVSLEAVPLILMRHLRFVIACAAAGKVAGVVSSRHRFGFGSAGSTGRPFCLSSRLFAKDEIRTLPLNESVPFSGYGVPPSTVGNNFSESFLPRVSNTGVWPDT